MNRPDHFPDARLYSSVMAYIQGLPLPEKDAIIHTIAETLYSDGIVWDTNREWSTEELPSIAATLGESGVFAAVEHHEGEKVFP